MGHPNLHYSRNFCRSDQHKEFCSEAKYTFHTHRSLVSLKNSLDDEIQIISINLTECESFHKSTRIFNLWFYLNFSKSSDETNLIPRPCFPGSMHVRWRNIIAIAFISVVRVFLRENDCILVMKIPIRNELH